MVCIATALALASRSGNALKFRNPAAKHFISNSQLSRLVIKLDNEVFTKIFQRNFRTQAGTKVPDFIGPFFKFVSWVTPRSSVIASNLDRPGICAMLLGSPLRDAQPIPYCV